VLCRRRSRRRVLLDIDISGLLSLGEVLPRMPCACAVSLARGGVARLIQTSMRLKYEPASEPLHMICCPLLRSVRRTAAGVGVRRWWRVLLDLDILGWAVIVDASFGA